MNSTFACHQLILKYRSRSLEEVNNGAHSISRLLSLSSNSTERQTEFLIVSLRDLFLGLQLGVFPSYASSFVSVLLSVLQDWKTIHPQVSTLVAGCLADIIAASDVKVPIQSLQALDNSRLPVLLHIMRAQVRGSRLEALSHEDCVELARNLNDTVAGIPTKKAVVAFLLSYLRIIPSYLMYQDCYDMLCYSMSNSLLNASVFEDRPENKKRSSKSVSLLSTTELDGSTPAHFFTVLCLAKHYSEDQQTNIESFAALYDLLLTLPSRQLMVAASAGEGPLSIPLATLRDRVQMDSVEEVALTYCLHVLKQAEVRPLKSSYDCGLQDAVISEAVRILDVLCRYKPAFVRKVFRSLVDLNDRAMRKVHDVMVLLTTFHFMLNHGHSANFELENMTHFMFCDLVPNSAITDSIFCSELLAKLNQSHKTVKSRTKIFSRYFPSLFKILAWNPRANLHLFLKLLPALITPTSAVEIFHLLLDLPCTSAALEISLVGERSYLVAVRQVAVAHPRDQRLRFVLEYFLRNETGRSHVLENIAEAHRMLREIAIHDRVIFCSTAVTALLSSYFGCVASSTKNQEIMKDLASSVLERMHSLYSSYSHPATPLIEDVMANGLALLFSRNRSLIVQIHSEICNYIVTNHFMSAKFLTSLVWCIGQHLPGDVAQTSPEVFDKFFGTIESLTYDVIKTQLTKGHGSLSDDWRMELFETCLQTMTKVGSMTHASTRRAVICLNNVVKKTREYPEEQRFLIVDQINSLIKLLELPSVSEIVMNLSISPEPEVLEAIRTLKSVAEEHQELMSGQSL
ncbi:hypothetical protein RvY_13738 [Ramazzottius varieornatus]|uniref:Uncharacterized protein n=1 Tax=Ramazzottius varieornatus TaxID=947166 RepID=A0A1D1VSY9_RAMVA|nr:hypothetical protein RvY_13738 [Ramazzottius varieornatus]